MPGGVGMPEGKAALGRVRFWVVIVAVVVIGALLFHSNWTEWQADGQPRAFKADGDFDEVISRFEQTRMVSIYTALAAREIAGGAVARITAPQDITELAERAPDVWRGESLDALDATYVRHASGGAVEASEYEVVLTAEELAELRRDATFVEYPFAVFAVAGATQENSVTLYTDEERHNVYVVPDSLKPEDDR
jgi:hypothetical protein